MGAIELETDADDLRLRAGLGELAGARLVRPVSDDPRETRLFMDCDLASLVENELGENADPRTFSEASRAEFESRSARAGLRLTSPRESAWCSTAFFLLEHGEIAGTVKLANRFLGSSLVGVSSLYVLPEYRRRGIARRTLSEARRMLGAHGAAGLSVPTCWTWQPAVRFYLSLRMWVESAENPLVFVWRDARFGWSVEVDQHDARFCVLDGGQEQFSIRAERRGDQLDLSRPRIADSPAAHLEPDAVQTFAVVLAINGWPASPVEDRRPQT